MDNTNSTQKNQANTNNTQSLREIDPSTWQRMPCMIRRRIDLTLADKVIYTYMLSQYKHFQALQKDYHENMEDIAKENGIGRTTVGDSVKRLTELGLITVFKKNVYNASKSVVSYSYSVKDEYNVFKSTEKPKVTTATIAPKVKAVTSKKFNPLEDDDDDYDPFA